MKKTTFRPSLFTLGLASFTLSTAAFAQTQQNPLVTLTGNLDPEYSVKVSEQDLAQIAAGLKGIQNMQAISVDVNSIYSEKDKAAFESASQEVTRILVDATKHLVDMRAIVYKLDIDLQRDSQNRFTQKIYEAYQGHFQKRFTKLIETFLGENASLKTALGDAMERCYTTPCLQDIADAQMDMIEFGQAINHRINLDSSRLMESSYQGFRSRLVKDAVQKTVDAFKQTNKTNSLYVQLLRTAAGPFVSAASGLKSSVSEMANFIASPTQSRFKIYADPIQKKNREWKIAQEQFEARVGENYKEIIENGNGAKQHPDNNRSASAQSEASNSMKTIDPTLYEALQTLNAQILDHQKTTPLGRHEIASLIGELLRKNPSSWVFLSFKKISTEIAKSNIRPWLGSIANFSGDYLYQRSILSISDADQNKAKASLYHIINYGDYAGLRDTHMFQHLVDPSHLPSSQPKIFSFPIGWYNGDHLELDFLSPYYAELNQSHHIIVTRINLFDYVKGVEGSYSINFDVQPPSAALYSEKK